MSDINTYTTAEIASLTPQSGDLVLNTDDNAVQLWNGSAWKIFNSDVSPFPLTHSVLVDGTNDYMSLASTTTAATGAYTLSFWMYPITKGWVFFGTGGQYINYYGSTQGNRLVIDGMGSITTPIDSITLNAWSHIFLVRDASNNVEVFINGSSAGTSASTYSGSFAFNKICNPSYGMEGNFDEFAFFTSDQSANLSSIYNSGVPSDLSSYSPTHWWRMGENDGGAGTTITDQGSGGIDATLVNGATFSTSVPS